MDSSSWWATRSGIAVSDQASAVSLVDHHGVLVLSRGLRQDRESVGHLRLERLVDLVRVGRRHGLVVVVRQRAGVLGQDVDLPALDRLEVGLPVADVELALHGDTLRLESLRVDLTEERRLREVRRPDGHRGGRTRAAVRRGRLVGCEWVIGAATGCERQHGGSKKADEEGARAKHLQSLSVRFATRQLPRWVELVKPVGCRAPSGCPEGRGRCRCRHATGRDVRCP